MLHGQNIYSPRIDEEARAHHQIEEHDRFSVRALATKCVVVAHQVADYRTKQVPNGRCHSSARADHRDAKPENRIVHRRSSAASYKESMKLPDHVISHRIAQTLRLLFYESVPLAAARLIKIEMLDSFLLSIFNHVSMVLPST